MNENEAGQILDWLSGSFGRRLEDNERHVWIATLKSMDATRAMEVALQYGQHGERFPSVPEFRQSVYRRVGSQGGDESWRDLPPERVSSIPDFVHVWYWARATRDEHRPFPQFEPRPADAMSHGEYEALKKEWEAAGAPRVNSVADLLSRVGA